LKIASVKTLLIRLGRKKHPCHIPPSHEYVFEGLMSQSKLAMRHPIAISIAIVTANARMILKMSFI